MRGVSGEGERVIPPRHNAGQVSTKTGAFRKDRPGRGHGDDICAEDIGGPVPRASTGGTLGLHFCILLPAHDGRATLAAFWGSSAETWRVLLLICGEDAYAVF